MWRDDEGVEHVITQGEGGEQGDPLMPALYALAQHDGLHEAALQLGPTAMLLAFLDDIYVVEERDRAAEAFHTVANKVEEEQVSARTWASSRHGAEQAEQRPTAWRFLSAQARRTSCGRQTCQTSTTAWWC